MEKKSVTIVTDMAYSYTNSQGQTMRAYYGTYSDDKGAMRICRITTSDEYALGETVMHYLIWSSKTKMMINLNI